MIVSLLISDTYCAHPSAILDTAASRVRSPGSSDGDDLHRQVS
jgi:hypothetical protein